MKRLKQKIKNQIKRSKLYLSIPLILGVSVGANVKNLKPTHAKSKKSELFNELSVFPSPMTTADLANWGAGDNAEIIPVYSGASYEQKIGEMASELPMEYNEHVKKYIDRYTVNSRTEVKDLLSRCDNYFPMIDEIFEAHGIPTELKYLAVIESGLKTDARSHAGAVGLWQFMEPAAKECNLRVDNKADERKNARKSTEAAAIYLKKLHGEFGDWFLALAAYNYGPGNVKKAIKKAGGGDVDFWDIRAHLPKETREYVPKFIAAAYVMENHEEHNIKPSMPVRYFAEKGSAERDIG